METSLSILLLGTQMAIGGAQKVLLDQANWFRQHGHKVIVVFFYDKEGSLPKWKAISDFPIIDLKAFQTDKMWGSNAFLLVKGLFSLWKLIKREKIDVIETFTHDSNILGLPLAWIARVPVRLASHHGVIDGYPRLRGVIHPFIVNYFADAVIAVSVKTEDQAIQEGIKKEQIVVIQNGIGLIPLEGINRLEVRKEAELENYDIFLVSVGRLVYQKAHQVLVSAMSIILAEFPNVKLGICGDGILRSQLEIQIRELRLSANVKLLGKWDNVAKFLSIADIFVLPSRWEGLPIALLEAMNAGLPVVATRVEGVDEVILDGVHGLLVAVEDVNALAQAILQLLRYPEMRKRMGSAAQARLRNFIPLTAWLGDIYLLCLKNLTEKFYENWQSMKPLLERFKYPPFIFGLLWVLAGACFEFREVAWGTGKWLGEFSFTWYVLYLSFVFLCLFLFLLANLYLYKQELLLPLIHHITGVRNRLRIFRWLLWLCIFILPIYFFQYSAWGIVFQKVYIRFLVWAVIVLFLSIIASNRDQFAGWREFLSSLVLTASAFSIAASLKYVNDYPFSLGWSEGNRLWDYSLLFGSHLYDYPADKKILALIDFGRQLVGGIPFIFPGVTITMERFWVGLTFIFPYLLLGLAAFRFLAQNKKTWFILTFWVFLFLKQGPIHPPLVLSAALVALAWGTPLWLSIPLVAGAGYFAQASRFSWVFAPGMWIVMLEFASASFSDRKSAAATWVRSATLGISGLFGGLLLPKIMPIVSQIFNSPVTAVSPNFVEQMADSGLTSNIIVREVTDQPLLWYRLLPNSTYGYGILFALLLAVGPIIAILLYMTAKKIWKINNLQKLSLVLPLLAFLVVGLVASTKIGGGGNLHNMDMFLIGLLFVGILAWQGGGKDWILNQPLPPFLIKTLVIFMIFNSSWLSLLEMRSYSFGEDLSWLRTLTDAPSFDDLGMLPTEKKTSLEIQFIQDEVDKAKPQGDVLFIDQRQLLTFGYIKNVPLVPEYEKKILMNEALASREAYIQEFYKDLADHRFSLIISEPLRTPIQDSTFQFGEENNAWVERVSGPVLCYYEELKTLKDVKVQLLVPKINLEDCSSVMPK